ncbi:hypothetical protein ABT061_24585 [Streptosporangium sp. NPDC002544]|uniref:hypothetical protein n=1 Tax=Streptosporangium sp. NPDC002544 TaxID=3154538 RepID=UPI003319444F
MATEAALRAGWWRVVGRGVLFLAAMAASWWLIGIIVALGSGWSFLGVLLGLALVGCALVVLVGISEDVPWAVWGTFPFLAVLLLTGMFLPGDYYLSTFGEPVTTTVAERTWVEGRKSKDDHYRYVLRGPDGRLLEEVIKNYRDEPPLEIGAPVEMLVDPRGVFEAREPSELGSLTVLWISAAWVVLMTIVLSVMGELRRRTMLPKGSGASKADDSERLPTKRGSGNSAESDRPKRANSSRRSNKRRGQSSHS